MSARRGPESIAPASLHSKYEVYQLVRLQQNSTNAANTHHRSTAEAITQKLVVQQKQSRQLHEVCQLVRLQQNSTNAANSPSLSARALGSLNFVGHARIPLRNDRKSGALTLGAAQLSNFSSGWTSQPGASRSHAETSCQTTAPARQAGRGQLPSTFACPWGVVRLSPRSRSCFPRESFRVSLGRSRQLAGKDRPLFWKLTQNGL